MAITAVTHRVDAEQATSSSTSITTNRGGSSGAYTPVANKKQICIVACRTSGAMASPTSATVSGCGITWTYVTHNFIQNNNLGWLYLFEGEGPTPSSGAVTFTAGGSDTFNGAMISVEEISSDGVVDIVASASNWGDTGTQPSVSITQGDGTALLFGALRVIDTTSTPRTDWSELFDDHNGFTNSVTLATQYRIGSDTAGSGTFVQTTGGWVGIVVSLQDIVVEELAQHSYRFRNDDGSETTATWAFALNTPGVFSIGSPFRVRALLDATGELDAIDALLEYYDEDIYEWRTIV